MFAAALGACRAGAPSGAPTPVRADSGRAGDSATAGARDTAGVPDSLRPSQRARVDPSTAVRFEIASVGDTTFVFLAPTARWVRADMEGIAVDPRRRDVLVARFRVLEARGDSVAALVTGQMARVTTDHVALISRPPEPPRIISRVEHRRFWAGTAVGGLLGLIAGLLIGL